MKIAISAVGQTLDSEVDPRFGRCRYFVIVDPESMQFEAVENSSAMASGGAGISAAQMIAGKSVQAVLTGNCGPNVYQVLSGAGIQVITGVSGSGKSSLLYDTLYPILSRHFYRSLTEPLLYRNVEGLEHIDKVIEVDQAPIGKPPGPILLLIQEYLVISAKYLSKHMNPE